LKLRTFVSKKNKSLNNLNCKFSQNKSIKYHPSVDFKWIFNWVVNIYKISFQIEKIDRKKIRLILRVEILFYFSRLSLCKCIYCRTIRTALCSCKHINMLHLYFRNCDKQFRCCVMLSATKRFPRLSSYTIFVKNVSKWTYLSPAANPSITATSIVCDPSGPMFVNLIGLLSRSGRKFWCKVASTGWRGILPFAVTM